MTPSNTQSGQQAQTAGQIVTQNRISTTVIVKSLSILLGVFFIFIGALKISPIISSELHRDLRREFVRYSKVFPFASWFEVKVPSKWYRRVFGALEIICGFCMVFVPKQKIKNAANIILLLLTLLSIYNSYMAKDPFERTGPALVFTFMLTGRLVVWYQIYRKEMREEAEKAQIGKQD